MRLRIDRCQPAYHRLHPAGPGNEQEIYHPEHAWQRRWGYLARETLANAQRQVVIKEMLDYYDPADPHSAARAHKRFETEAGTLVTLSYAGIPQIFDYFSEGGRNYIVMQFIQGQNLESGRG
jgi:serine/threonine protein kinase